MNRSAPIARQHPCGWDQIPSDQAIATERERSLNGKYFWVKFAVHARDRVLYADFAWLRSIEAVTLLVRRTPTYQFYW